jgi:hypothetical protein
VALALGVFFLLGIGFAGVEALIRVLLDMVSDARCRNGFADASFRSNTSVASVEGLAVDLKSALLVRVD